MKKIALVGVSSALLLLGCATTSPVAVEKPIDTYSSFDSSKSIVMKPAFLECLKYNYVCGNLGFEWNEKDPNNSYVLISIDDSHELAKWHGISGVSFNIDGDIIALKPLSSGSDTGTDKHRTVTSKLFVTPLSVIERVRKSNNTKVQIDAINADFDYDFENANYKYTERFLNKINQAKSIQ